MKQMQSSAVFPIAVDTLNFETSWYQWQKPDKKRYAVIEKVKKFGSGKKFDYSHHDYERKIHNSC